MLFLLRHSLSSVSLSARTHRDPLPRQVHNAVKSLHAASVFAMANPSNTEAQAKVIELQHALLVAQQELTSFANDASVEIGGAADDFDATNVDVDVDVDVNVDDDVSDDDVSDDDDDDGAAEEGPDNYNSNVINMLIEAVNGCRHATLPADTTAARRAQLTQIVVDELRRLPKSSANQEQLLMYVWTLQRDMMAISMDRAAEAFKDGGDGHQHPFVPPSVLPIPKFGLRYVRLSKASLIKLLRLKLAAADTTLHQLFGVLAEPAALASLLHRGTAWHKTKHQPGDIMRPPASAHEHVRALEDKSSAAAKNSAAALAAFEIARNVTAVALMQVKDLRAQAAPPRVLAEARAAAVVAMTAEGRAKNACTVAEDEVKDAQAAVVKARLDLNSIERVRDYPLEIADSFLVNGTTAQVLTRGADATAAARRRQQAMLTGAEEARRRIAAGEPARERRVHTEELAIARKQRELQTLAAPIANKTKMELQHEHMQKNQRLIAGGGLLHGADCGGSRVVTMVSQPIKPGQSRGTASDTGWLLPHAMQLTQQQRRRKCGGHKNQRKKGGKLGRTRGKHRGKTRGRRISDQLCCYNACAGKDCGDKKCGRLCDKTCFGKVSCQRWMLLVRS